jgi:hypothetical protein
MFKGSKTGQNSWNLVNETAKSERIETIKKMVKDRKNIFTNRDSFF